MWFGSPSTHSAASYSTVSALRWLQVRIVPEHFIPRRENLLSTAEPCQKHVFSGSWNQKFDDKIGGEDSGRVVVIQKCLHRQRNQAHGCFVDELTRNLNMREENRKY